MWEQMGEDTEIPDFLAALGLSEADQKSVLGCIKSAKVRDLSQFLNLSVPRMVVRSSSLLMALSMDLTSRF